MDYIVKLNEEYWLFSIKNILIIHILYRNFVCFSRRKTLGEAVLPNSDKDLLNLPAQYQTLDSGEQFLLSAEEVSGGVALIFMSQFGRRILAESDVWYMDGTFQSVPDQFAQLYVIFGSGGPGASEKIYPSAYMLLPSKSADAYKHAFQAVKAATINTPVSISIDFKSAVIKSAKEVFPNLQTIQGCRFHRKKNLFFQVGQKGCLQLFNNDENFQVGLDLIYCLDKVPARDMTLAWEEVIQPFFEENFADDNQKVKDFLGYVERNYISKINSRTGKRNTAMFPPNTWSNYERFMNNKPTTNNAV